MFKMRAKGRQPHILTWQHDDLFRFTGALNQGPLTMQSQVLLGSQEAWFVQTGIQRKGSSRIHPRLKCPCLSMNKVGVASSFV